MGRIGQNPQTGGRALCLRSGGKLAPYGRSRPVSRRLRGVGRQWWGRPLSGDGRGQSPCPRDGQARLDPLGDHVTLNLGQHGKDVQSQPRPAWYASQSQEPTPGLVAHKGQNSPFGRRTAGATPATGRERGVHWPILPGVGERVRDPGRVSGQYGISADYSVHRERCRGFLQVQVLPGELSVGPSSYRGGEEGNRIAEALGTSAHHGWVCESTGPNACEARAGLESEVVSADLPE